MMTAGCTTGYFWEEDPPEKLLTIHEVTSEGRDTEGFAMIIAGTKGQPDLWVRKIPMLHSKYIEGMEVVRGTRGQVGLKCHLNKHGRYLWTQTRTMFAGRTMAVLVDGELAFFWRIPSGGEDFASHLVLEGTWSREEAAAVAAQSRRNYEVLN